VLLLVLDRYHLGDPLFVSRLARDLLAHRGPLLLVHDSAEEGERALEGEGADAARVDGRLTAASEGERALVERALRELNRRITHELNEAGLPVVRALGVDRGLLKRGADGALTAGRVGWLGTLAGQGALPVVGALVAGPDGRPVEADAASAAAALARALEGEGARPTVLFLTTDRRPGLFAGGVRLEAVNAAALPASAPLGDAAGVRRIGGTVRVRLTGYAALRAEGEPEGTDVTASPAEAG
jgi:hypothetical protein